MNWQRVASLDALRDGQAIGVDIAGTTIALFRLGDEIHATSGICSHAFGLLADGYVDRDPALPGPVDVLQVKQQGELIDDEGQSGAVADGDSGVTALPFLAPDGHRADTGQQANAPHVVMQVLAADAEVAERAPAFLDAVGDTPDRAERDGEREPAEQGLALPGIQILVVSAADVPNRRGLIRR